MARFGQNMNLGSTGISSNDYNGGAVVFNQQPYINYYTNQKLREQAREDAFYKYFGGLGNNLTPAGMHTKDIPGLMQQKNDWQNYMMQNREAIARPGLDEGKAYTEAMGRYNSMMSYINQSKNDVKTLASLKPILDSPQKKYLLNDVTMQRIHQGSLPINDPNYRPFDPSSIDFNPPPFDAKQANQMRLNMTQYKPSDNPITIPLPNHQEQTVHNYKFSQNDLNGIYTQGAMAYHTNPSFQGEIDKVKDDPEMHGRLNSLFNEHYGRDMQSPEDASAAYMLSLHPDISNKVEQPRNIPYSPWETAAAGLNREKQFYDYKQDQQSTQDALVTESYMSNLENQAKKNPPATYMPMDGQPMKSYKLPMTEQLQKAFEVKSPDGKKTYQPDEMHVLENGNWLPEYYKYEQYTAPDGKIHSRPAKSADGTVALDHRLSQPVSREIAKTNLDQVLLTKKSAERQSGTVGKSPTPSTHITQKSQKTTFGSGGLN